MKKQIKVKGWLYECEIKGAFKWSGAILEYQYDYFNQIMKTKKGLEGDSCICGKNCKPIKVELILRKIK